MNTVNQTDYQKQATDFLKKYDLKFSVILIDNIPDERNKEQRHDVYRCVFRRVGDYDNKLIVPRFTQSIIDSSGKEWVQWNSERAWDANEYCSVRGGKPNTPKRPTAYDVLACLTKNDPGSLKDFTSDYGQSGDSLKDLRTYKAVRREWRGVRAFFTDAELEAAQEIA